MAGIYSVGAYRGACVNCLNLLRHRVMATDKPPLPIVTPVPLEIINLSRPLVLQVRELYTLRPAWHFLRDMPGELFEGLLAHIRILPQAGDEGVTKVRPAVAGRQLTRSSQSRPSSSDGKSLLTAARKAVVTFVTVCNGRPPAQNACQDVSFCNNAER